ncbi:DUF3631 domain-containing protein [Planosporangium sp. 12N6]|uniref:DUF3631 domain-containing protein n=1 Tax=Planosporangium spinosum TaxID=3402278 RepID=UPI003CF6AFFE
MTTPKTPTDGAAILDRLHAALTRYVILPSAEAIDATVLWIAATHAQPAWAHAPRLVIRAPEKRCGKSRLLDIVEATCHNPLITVNASPAAVYRAIGSDNPPTLLIDEADTIFGGDNAKTNEDLRGLLNAGHQRNRPAIRWDPNTRTLEQIPTFAMAALAGIGAMPDTIEDRAAVIRMRRRAAGETVAPYRHRRDAPALRALAADLTAWLSAHLAELERAEPAMPLEDRAADTWEPLIAVADLAGNHWPDRGRHAAETLTAERDGATATSDRIRLLTDCRAAFGEADAIPTTVLLDRLKADPEAPWAEYANTGLNAMRLAALLREYDIRSTTIRFAAPIGQAKGYYRADFVDAWNRYAPVTDDSTAPAPYQPYQPYLPSSTPVRPEVWYGSSRTTEKAVPALTSTDTAGTAGTATRRLHLAEGAA